MIAHQFEQLYVFFTEMEDHYLVIEEEKEAVHQTLAEKEKKIESLNTEVTSLRAELKEKENEILEKQCALLEMKNEYILMENKCKMTETTIEEMSKWKSVVKKSEEELEVSYTIIHIIIIMIVRLIYCRWTSIVGTYVYSRPITIL